MLLMFWQQPISMIIFFDIAGYVNRINVSRCRLCYRSEHSSLIIAYIRLHGLFQQYTFTVTALINMITWVTCIILNIHLISNKRNILAKCVRYFSQNYVLLFHICFTRKGPPALVHWSLLSLLSEYAKLKYSRDFLKFTDKDITIKCKLCQRH